MASPAQPKPYKSKSIIQPKSVNGASNKPGTPSAKIQSTKSWDGSISTLHDALYTSSYGSAANANTTNSAVPESLKLSHSCSNSLTLSGGSGGSDSRPGSPAQSHPAYSELEAAYDALQRKYEIRKQREHEMRLLLNTVLSENAMLKNKLMHLENMFTEIGHQK